jgi:6-phosphogluconolactonase
MKLFVGCYSQKLTEDLIGKGEGIYYFDFNEESGQLNLIDVIPARNPSYLTLSEDGRFLYAVEELPIEEKARIKAFKINSEDNAPGITLINEQDLPGSFACHLSLSKSQDHLMVASYMSGNVLVYPIGKEGSVLPLIQNIQHYGAGPDKDRQESPHPHMVYPVNRNDMYIVDLGLDLARFYKFDQKSGLFDTIRKYDIEIRKGAGARHMLVHPDSDYVFIFSEMSAEVFSFRKNGEKTDFIEVISSLPDDHTGVPSGAAIRMHPNGRFLYVSNRSNNSVTIIRFDKESEKMSVVGYEQTGGSTPRDFNIDPDGKWLLAANQDSDTIVVFRINQSSGLLEKSHVNSDIKTPSCIQFY